MLSAQRAAQKSCMRMERLTQCFADIAGTKQPSTTAPEAGKSQQNGVDKTLPASQHVPLGVGTVSTQVALLSRQQHHLSALNLILGLVSGQVV